MESSANEAFHELVKYEAPSWCTRLKIKPEFRIPLAMKPTPIHRWNVKGVPKEFVLSVKREDLTGCALSGNKVRKLEFILADAKARGYTDVITMGSTESNHARATVIAATQIGLQCHLVLCEKHENCRTAPLSGNFLLMEAIEPNIYLLPWTVFSDENVDRAQKVLAEQIKKEPGRAAYCIPSGGDTPIGLYGYIDVWEELMQQKIQERFDDIVCVAGSCGTAVGLAIGNFLTGSKLRLHTISIDSDEEYIHNLIDDRLSTFGLEDVRSRDIIDVIDDHVGGGYYSKSTKEEIDYCCDVAKTSGILCDPVYVGKGLRGLTKELNTNPQRFKGRRVLYIHTGGLFGLMKNPVNDLMRSQAGIGKIVDWKVAFPDESDIADTSGCK